MKSGIKDEITIFYFVVRKSKMFFLLILAIISLVFRCSNQKNYHDDWGNLKNLGSCINSEGKDEHVTLTEDGKMFFASIRDGGKGGYDIYRSELRNGKWSEAILLPEPINSDKDEFDPFISKDGRYLFFASNRNNSDKYWDCDIFVSEWNQDGWEKPHIFDSVFITEGKPDWGVTMTGDLKTLIFSSGRNPCKEHTVQIFISRLIENRWTKPEILPEPVNSGIWEATPYIKPDGKILYLNSARGGNGKKDVDIWRIEYRNGEWINAVRMEGSFYSNHNDYDPCISYDGEKFYFTSDREGGMGDSDIYVMEWVKQD